EPVHVRVLAADRARSRHQPLGGECPRVEGISFAVPGPEGGKANDWVGRLDGYGQSVDQRVKMPGWIDELERRGGRMELNDVGVEDLERFTRTNDLVIVAAGKGDRAPVRTRRRPVAL